MTEIKTLQQAREELLRRRYEDPLEHVYTPHAAQLMVHRDRHPITVCLGGNRTGKSTCAMAEAIMYCLGRPIHAEVPDVPAVVWYVMPSLTMFRRAVLPIFRKLIPQSTLKRYSYKDNVAYFNNGSELHFLSADMRQRRLQGASVDFIVMDEAMRSDVFEELQARVFDRKGRILMVLTPVDEIEANWIWIRDQLYIPWEIGERPDVNVVHMPIADKDGNSLVPQFTNEDIEKFERMYPDPQVRAARMYGQFVTRSGLVFQSFDPDTHLIGRFDIPSNFHRWIVVDPQYHRFAALFFSADEKGCYYVTDEYFSQDEPLAVRAKRIWSIVDPHRDYHGPSLPCYVDSANPQDVAELNWHFSRIGAPIGAIPLPMQKQVEKMVLRVHSMLEPDPAREFHYATGLHKVFGAPRLVFFEDIVSDWKLQERQMRSSRLFWELRRLTWDSSSGRPNKKSADGADASDCLIYGCSIMASGLIPDRSDDWKQGMSPGDIIIWEAIERQDKRYGGDKWKR